MPARRKLWYVASIAVVILGLGFGLDGYPLLDPDEGRNAEIAREMAVTNDYVLPRLNDMPYLDKPVLYFAAEAAAMEVLGPTVLAARLISLLFTVATLILVAWFGRRLFGATAGWIAAVATGSTPLTMAYARTVIFDSALTFFVVLALAALYVAVDHSEETAGRPSDRTAAGWWAVAAWVAIGLGVLTKGPIALGLPLMIAVPYVAWRRRWRVVGEPVGLLAFVAVLLPWVLAVTRRAPGFLEYALVSETMVRLTTDAFHRTGPIWYFVPILLAGTLPWSPVVIGGWRDVVRRHPTGELDRRVVYLLLWIVVPLIFFSLSQSKAPQYVLPTVPGVGLLVAHLWSRDRPRLPGARAAALALLGTAALVVAAHPMVRALVNTQDAVYRAVPSTAIMLGAVIVAAATGAWLSAQHRPRALFALTLPVAAIPLVSGDLMNAIGRERSAAALAEAIHTAAPADVQIVAIGTYPLSLPFYLRRTFVLATDDASELTSNYLKRHVAQWRREPGSPLRPSDWWRDALLECNRPRIFLANASDRATREVLDAQLPLLATSRKVAVYGPCGVTALAGADRVADPWMGPQRARRDAEERSVND